ncbi:tetraacyldisaccharide 4'-kinase [Natroniella sulfidigena]|uniref:tetraacyldisaccharide 4'-kinase n=1 Tax=Natroniella sulfidigena TaxID=723921 RepID=UPI00200AAE43|nr:tetraacyldisaccharide 4'-kinase [Natroniella sulfidigena]MCK8816352.1 tetraacyldisaccharide 4'-kinase [Natroniella sulfidigena]
MGVEEYLLELVQGNKTGIVAHLLLAILKVLSKIYGTVIFMRRKLYQWGFKEEKVLPTKVISIGNITVGGTGKTPLVKLLALTLLESDYQVVILNRGYKADFSGDIGVVSDGREILMDAKQAGDEAFMLAKELPEVPVIIGSARRQTGAYAAQRFEPDFIILDDGFQHWQVARDYDLVVIDATNPFDNEELLPRGLLREPVSSLNRAHAFLLTKTDQVEQSELTEIRRRLIEINPAATIITTKHQPTYLRKLVNDRRQEVDLQEEKVLAVSGIGNPESFEQTLTDLGAEVVDQIRFKDHHQYSKEEILEVFSLASEVNVDRIVTTEKDAVSIKPELVTEIGQERIDFDVLGIELQVINSQNKFSELVSKMEVARCK